MTGCSRCGRDAPAGLPDPREIAGEGDEDDLLLVAVPPSWAPAEGDRIVCAACSTPAERMSWAAMSRSGA